MKTILEHLQTLPEPYKSEAIGNTSLDRLAIEFDNISDALCAAFLWSESSQGHKYWSVVHVTYC